ncbi:MAG: hypothetical protein IJZ25_04675 [Lachnospiraceae bacterium]|nr:hypothetical protein [Lachnospiraceae bacterium]
MNQLYQQLLNRRNYLVQLREEITRQSEDLPKGRLRINNDRGIARYYYINKDGDTHGEYISKKDVDLACKLAQKDYLHKVYRTVNDELKDIEKYLLRHKEHAIEDVFTNLNSYRQNLVTPLAISDELYVQQWEQEPYETNPYCPDEKVYPTKKDELVRSKSEVLLADMFYEMGIPYRYEAQLVLKNGKVRYPDFTLLRISTRELIYHEHFGLLDNEEYRRACVVKLGEYRKNGIYPGKNLLITYEAEGLYLNIKEIREQMQVFFARSWDLSCTFWD